ncbi:MAG: 4Fe-4S ferredoxin [Proteobacteria bacterium]|nr:4Fe-4S ferredoxin [Pseudomonadota bacterium]
MSLREVVKIDEEKCTGCGECVPACAEGAIQIIDGVAKLVADNLCDGLGACLGDCPEDAITIEERDADEFDEEAVEEHMKNLKPEAPSDAASVTPIAEHPHAHEHGPGGGCPGARMIQFDPPRGEANPNASGDDSVSQPSELRQWPIQLHLVPPTAPYFKKADVLLAADCIAFAVGDFHKTHLKGSALAIACPKLDQGQEIYLQKLIAMIDEAGINTLTVMVMEVPCCTGLVQLAKEAATRANRKVPVKKIVVGLRGDILGEEWV